MKAILNMSVRETVGLKKMFDWMLTVQILSGIRQDFHMTYVSWKFNNLSVYFLKFRFRYLNNIIEDKTANEKNTFKDTTLDFNSVCCTKSILYQISMQIMRTF